MFMFNLCVTKQVQFPYSTGEISTPKSTNPLPNPWVSRGCPRGHSPGKPMIGALWQIHRHHYPVEKICINRCVNCPLDIASYMYIVLLVGVIQALSNWRQECIFPEGISNSCKKGKLVVQYSLNFFFFFNPYMYFYGR